jgi:hypothetical protein
LYPGTKNRSSPTGNGAGLVVQSHDGLVGGGHDLKLSCVIGQDRGGEAHRILARGPDDLARLAVQGDQAPSAGPADLHENQLTGDQRGADKTEIRDGRRQVGIGAQRPQLAAVVEAHGEDPPQRADGVDDAVLDRGNAGGTALGAALRRKLRVDTVAPDFLAARRVEGRQVIVLAVREHGDETPVDDRHPGVGDPQRAAPGQLEGERTVAEQPRGRRLAVVVRSAPVRPVRAEQQGDGNQQDR